MSRYFTVKQANDAIPHVNEMFENILRLKDDLTRIERQIVTSSGTLAKFVPLKQNLNSTAREFYESIEKLEATGVIIKSIDEGLLDFPAERYGEEMWLCWKFGETDVKFWHEKDSGFSGRKPLESNDESLV